MDRTRDLYISNRRARRAAFLRRRVAHTRGAGIRGVVSRWTYPLGRVSDLVIALF
jgi:hypothetical protein